MAGEGKEFSRGGLAWDAVASPEKGGLGASLSMSMAFGSQRYSATVRNSFTVQCEPAIMPESRGVMTPTWRQLYEPYN